MYCNSMVIWYHSLSFFLILHLDFVRNYFFSFAMMFLLSASTS